MLRRVNSLNSRQPQTRGKFTYFHYCPFNPYDSVVLRFGTFAMAIKRGKKTQINKQIKNIPGHQGKDEETLKQSWTVPAECRQDSWHTTDQQLHENKWWLFQVTESWGCLLCSKSKQITLWCCTLHLLTPPPFRARSLIVVLQVGKLERSDKPWPFFCSSHYDFHGSWILKDIRIIVELYTDLYIKLIYATLYEQVK